MVKRAWHYKRGWRLGRLGMPEPITIFIRHAAVDDLDAAMLILAGATQEVRTCACQWGRQVERGPWKPCTICDSKGEFIVFKLVHD